MTYYIVNKCYKFYPYRHKDNQQWTWMIEHAREYEYNEAKRECDYLMNHDRPATRGELR